jgi:hypothetical protein
VKSIKAEAMDLKKGVKDLQDSDKKIENKIDENL